MLLQDNKERQVVLGQNPHTKEFTVAVYNKETGKKSSVIKRKTKARQELWDLLFVY